MRMAQVCFALFVRHKYHPHIHPRVFKATVSFHIVFAYLIFVTGTTGGAFVIKIVRCKIFLIEHENGPCILQLYFTENVQDSV